MWVIKAFFRWLWYCKITGKHQYRKIGWEAEGPGGKVTFFFRCEICGKWKKRFGYYEEMISGDVDE
ncbi:MAG: hypothetical protein ACOC80_15690 [Petrotogales bacterium]